ncbi:MAG: hypothetical protein HKN54_01440 [Flavobacteriaceae bacterium]|nr:hypothetical protein [Flavobacteriaceae bacterium]
MMQNSRQENKFSRRRFFPLLGGSLIVPFFGIGQNEHPSDSDPNADYDTLLKPDGTIVKVKSKVIKESKVINKNVSNTSMLKWLKGKF